MAETRSREMGLELILDLRATRNMDNPAEIERCIRKVVEVTGLELRRGVMQRFDNGTSFGHGITAVGILSESDVVIHTSPECGIVNVNLYSCVPFSVVAATSVIDDFFGTAASLQVQTLRRH